MAFRAGGKGTVVGERDREKETEGKCDENMSVRRYSQVFVAGVGEVEG